MGEDFELVAVAERLHRSCKRDGPRLIFINPLTNRFSSHKASDNASKKILKHEFHRVMGVYDGNADFMDILEDVEWFARRWGLLGEWKAGKRS
jgi:hypothetical protein